MVGDQNSRSAGRVVRLHERVEYHRGEFERRGLASYSLEQAGVAGRSSLAKLNEWVPLYIKSAFWKSANRGFFSSICGNKIIELGKFCPIRL